MRIEVLGELRLSTGPLRGRAAELLRLLVTGQGRPVAVHTITEVLWGDHPPRSAGANLHTYASRVRAVLDDDARLVHAGGGYRLLGGDRDLTSFVALAASGDPVCLREALVLWQGPPITAAMRERSVVAEGIACRFEELRLQAYARLAAAVEPASIVGELRQLVAEHPRRESVHALLVRALYEAGDAAAALLEYHRLRRALADELGVEPSAPLRALYRSVLRNAA
ncbi:AfsR/SARP family transcriptional regulator [Paractinoplanes lichenicola]|uniref:Winged helix-turn-helix domain-containing protein n=1 Tax=Paractinoplanes lichenicola TaxID=2802976 RepID=A0ABS1VU50_9ACTN|nr:BTAD domain-containing putative transcriptional regulator [Actinoplanes lichenicola]MBL7257985.1 winged helix-turn-helix domain-containing protein [Actinoplanes lichenicola]